MRRPPSGLGRRTKGSPRRTSASRGGGRVSRHCRGAVPAGCGYRSSVLSRRRGAVPHRASRFAQAIPLRAVLPALHTLSLFVWFFSSSRGPSPLRAALPASGRVAPRGCLAPRGLRRRPTGAAWRSRWGFFGLCGMSPPEEIFADSKGFTIFAHNSLKSVYDYGKFERPEEGD